MGVTPEIGDEGGTREKAEGTEELIDVFWAQLTELFDTDFS